METDPFLNLYRNFYFSSFLPAYADLTRYTLKKHDAVLFTLILPLQPGRIMIPESKGDFRHCMSCQDCWAFFLDIPACTSHCRIENERQNRPVDIPSGKIRLGLDMVLESKILHRWPCIYRYTYKEVEQMKAGKLKEIHVTKEDAARGLEKITDDMRIGYNRGY